MSVETKKKQDRKTKLALKVSNWAVGAIVGVGISILIVSTVTVLSGPYLEAGLTRIPALRGIAELGACLPAMVCVATVQCLVHNRLLRPRVPDLAQGYRIGAAIGVWSYIFLKRLLTS
jgi:hypothetical protein